MAIYEVGAPFPLPIASEGMTAVIAPGDEAPSITLVCALGAPTPAEIAALTKGRLRLAIVPSPPLTWIVLDAGSISFDAPYALGVEAAERRAAIAESLARASRWSAETRNLVTVATVDIDTGMTRGLRAATLSRAWWLALASGMSAAAIDPASRDAAIDRDLRRWRQTADMLRAASALEVVGL
jgi:hypothetical protein